MEFQMKLWKRIAPMIAVGIVGAVTITTTASAHNEDYWGGNYIGESDADILLRVSSSAQTDFLNRTDVYSGGFDWNNISTNANVRIAYSVQGMPQLPGEMYVVGEYRSDRTPGKTIPYSSTGVIALKGNTYDVHGDWAYVEIVMNTNPSAYSGASNPSAAARMTFTHEV